jgi:hypothetical protein
VHIFESNQKSTHSLSSHTNDTHKDYCTKLCASLAQVCIARNRYTTAAPPILDDDLDVDDLDVDDLDVDDLDIDDLDVDDLDIDDLDVDDLDVDRLGLVGSGLIDID